MTSRVLIGTSFLTLLATLLALVAIALRKPRRHTAVFVFLMTSAIWKACNLAWSPYPELDYYREACYALAGIWVALETWRCERPLSLFGQISRESAGVGAIVVCLAGALAMSLPGPHPDYRPLVPLCIAVAVLLLCAAHFAQACRYRVEGVACWGLAMIFVAQACHCFGFEFSLDLAALGLWAHVAAWCWAMLEIALAAWSPDPDVIQSWRPTIH